MDDVTELGPPNPKRKIILLQKNTRSHTAIESLKLENISSQPKSHFPKIENGLRGQRFKSPQEAVDSFKNCFQNLLERMQSTLVLLKNTSKNNEVLRVIYCFIPTQCAR